MKYNKGVSLDVGAPALRVTSRNYPFFIIRVNETTGSYGGHTDRTAQKDIVPVNTHLETHNTKVSYSVSLEECPGCFSSVPISLDLPAAHESYW